MAELAENMRERGQYLPVLVRAENGDILDGLDRVAAAFLIKWKTISMVALSCDDVEAALVREEVNVKRRHDKAQETTRRLEVVDSLAAQEAESDDAAPQIDGPGRPRTAKGRARVKAATMLSTTKHALEQAEYRKRRKAGLTKATAPIDALGMSIPESVYRDMMTVCALFDSAALRVSQALACMTEVESQAHRFPPARLQHLRAELSDVAGNLRNARPKMLCPYCKGIPVLLGGCRTCVGSGLLSANQVQGVPPELLDPSRPQVQVAGKLRSAWDYIPQLPESDPFGLEDTDGANG